MATTTKMLKQVKIESVNWSKSSDRAPYSLSVVDNKTGQLVSLITWAKELPDDLKNLLKLRNYEVEVVSIKENDYGIQYTLSPTSPNLIRLLEDNFSKLEGTAIDQEIEEFEKEIAVTKEIRQDTPDITAEIVEDTGLVKHGDDSMVETLEETKAPAFSSKIKGISELALSKENIKKYICPKATDQELAMFLALCVNQNLNPFIKDVYLIKYGNSPAQMVVAKDTFIKRADLLPNYQGFKAGILIIRKDGEVEESEGSFILPDEQLVGGWATVFRTDRKPYYNSVSLAEYNKRKSSWLSMPATMIRKVALVQAMREAFPQDFQGMYDQAELEEVQ